MNRDRAKPEQTENQTPSITGFVIVAVVALGSFLMLLLAPAAPRGQDARSTAQIACGIDEPFTTVPWKPSWTCLASLSFQPLH
jgi:hypothetical protein